MVGCWVGILLELSVSLPVLWSLAAGFGGGVGGGVGAEEVGVAGEGVAGLAVDEEADLGDLGEGGVEGADDGVEGEGFDLDAGGVVVDEGAAEVDDGELAGAVSVGGLVVASECGDGDEEDVVDGGAALERMGGAGRA